MSIFGATNTPAPQTGGGLFGASNTQQQQPAGGGLFGAAPAQNTTQPTNSNPLFGNTGATNTGGGLFGQSANTNNAAQGTAGGGLFGGGQQQQQQPAGGGGLFGNAQTQPAASGGGLFGASTQQQPAATSGGLFGASTQQTQPTATNGGLFGASTTQQQPTGGLFGSSTTAPAATGGGLFGAPTSTQPATNGGGLFGASTAQPQQQNGGLFGGGGGLFGSKPGLNINTNTNTSGTAPATNNNPLFGGGAFGQSQAQQQQPAAGNPFSQAKPSIFGQSSTAATGLTNNNPLFGGWNNSTLGTSALGGTGQSGGFGSSILGRTTTGPAQQQDAQGQHNILQQRIEGVYNAWNPASPQCRFQHAFYNNVDPAKVAYFQRPQNISNELWEKARRENPDPSCFVPAFATGFDDLRLRVEAQSVQSEKLKQRLTDVKKRLDALSERHALSNFSRLQRAATQQIQVTQRLLTFVQHLHLLIPAVRSSAIRPEEEQLRGQLEEVEEEIRRGRLAGKLNELWALIGAVAAAAERGRGADGNGGEWVVVDEEGLAQIAQILSEQQAGLAHLTKVLQKAQKDLSVVLATPGGVAEDTSSFSESWGSANAHSYQTTGIPPKLFTFHSDMLEQSIELDERRESSRKQVPEDFVLPVIGTDGASPETPIANSSRSKKQTTAAHIQFIACCVPLFLAGWNDGSLGPLLPRIQLVYNVICNIFACEPQFSQVKDQFHSGFSDFRICLRGASLQIVGFTLMAPALPFPVFVMAFTINSLGVALQDAQANGYVASLESNSSAKMGVLHAVYECLRDIGQVIPERTETQRLVEESGKLRQIMRHRTVQLLAVFLLFYVGVEVTLGGWIVTYIIEVRHGGPSSGYISAGFFGGLMVGRVALLWVNEKIGERRVIFLYITLAIVLEFIIWFVPSLIGDAVAVSIVGMLLGPMYPIAMNHAGRVLPRWILTGAIGWMAGVGVVGSAFLPFTTGAISNKYGIKSLQPLYVTMFSETYYRP
ncbi:hypothetical protein DXG01_015400 [Tephrocybe rancida]|nr:hypothetical protein DXG01_015400 [Tephrocybe rancida]